MSHWIQRLACIIALAAVTGLPAAALACAIVCAAPVTGAAQAHHGAPARQGSNAQTPRADSHQRSTPSSPVAARADRAGSCHRAGLAGLQLRAPSHDCSNHGETAIETSSTLVASRADDGIGIVPAVLAPAFLQPSLDHGLRARSDGPPRELPAGPLGPSGRLNLRI